MAGAHAAVATVATEIPATKFATTVLKWAERANR